MLINGLLLFSRPADLSGLSIVDTVEVEVLEDLISTEVLDELIVG